MHVCPFDLAGTTGIEGSSVGIWFGWGMLGERKKVEYSFSERFLSLSINWINRKKGSVRDDVKWIMTTTQGI